MLQQTQTFPCPSCKEIISDSMEACRFCGTAIDTVEAANAAQIQSLVNRACSDASFMRSAAATMFALLPLSLVPLISFATYIGFFITVAAVFVMLIRWQIKFGRIQTADVDYQRAR